VPVRQALQIASETAEAIDRAHQEGIVHRDLKPSNIMLAPDGHVKVMDFGLAKRLEREDEDITAALTREGTTLGTLAYMSPEQLKGKPVDTRSDIFSFGVVLYEMLTGVHPFRTGTQAETVNAILQEHPSPLSRYTEDTSDILQHTVEKMLAKDFEERYQSIREVRTNLKRLSEKLSVSGLAPASVKAKLSPLLTVGMVLAVLVAVFLTYYFYQPSPVSIDEAPIDSVAVLPFENLGDSEDEYLIYGLATRISSDLTKLPALRVIPTGELKRFRKQNVTPVAAGKELDVKAVVNGSVLPQGDSVAVNIELTDVKQGTLLWAGHYEQLSNEVQSQIAKEIADALRIELTERAQDHLARRYTDSDKAWRFYQRGQYLAQEWQGAEALDYFKQAIKEDPQFALAHASLSNIFWDLAVNENEVSYWDRSRVEAEKAFELDDQLAEAHAQMGFVFWHFDRDWVAAGKAYSRAAELNPGLGMSWLASQKLLYLLWMGHYEEAALSVDQLRDRTDPLSATSQIVLGIGYLLVRDYEKAIEQMRKIHKLEPDRQSFAKGLILQASYADRGKVEEFLEEAGAVGLGDEDALERLRKAYQDSGIQGFWSAFYDTEGMPNNLAARAEAHARLGETGLAFNNLEEYFNLKLRRPNPLIVRPVWDPLRSDPRFEELLRKLNLPEEAIQRHLSLQ
jgi:TolB-like protein/Tfp pilus assembly protein PilF